LAEPSERAIGLPIATSVRAGNIHRALSSAATTAS
jgi:hypothetical protein